MQEAELGLDGRLVVAKTRHEPWQCLGQCRINWPVLGWCCSQDGKLQDSCVRDCFGAHIFPPAFDKSTAVLGWQCFVMPVCSQTSAHSHDCMLYGKPGQEMSPLGAVFLCPEVAM